MSVWSKIKLWLSQGVEDPSLHGINPDKDVDFTMAVVGLSAKLAKGDGQVTEDEVRAFFEVFKADRSSMPAIRRIFTLAGQSVGGFEGYARKMHRRYENQPDILEKVMDGLFHIAKANGRVDPEELDYLSQVCRIFRFSDGTWRRLLQTHKISDEKDAYAILGVERGAKMGQIKRAYFRAMIANHPDKFIGGGYPKEFERSATAKAAAINGAYQKIMRDLAL